MEKRVSRVKALPKLAPEFRVAAYARVSSEKDAMRHSLSMMAKQSMTVENEKDLWRKTGSNQYVWSIEHIFPQGPNIPDEWVDMIADGDRAKAKEYQSLYVHTFGNLTITGYNSTLSNKAFAAKKERRDEVDTGYRAFGEKLWRI